MNALVYEMICDSCLAKWMKEQLKTKKGTGRIKPSTSVMSPCSSNH